MKCIIFSLLLLSTPVNAEDTESELRKELEEGLQQFSEGSRLLLQGLIGELLPLYEELGGLIDELNAYHPPEVLPNGDIIIRRKTQLEREMEKNQSDEIDL